MHFDRREGARDRHPFRRCCGGLAARRADDFHCAHGAMMDVRAVAMDPIE
jgi:hypothetical protein